MFDSATRVRHGTMRRYFSPKSIASTPVRVLLVDDHTMVRSSLRALLEHSPGIEIVGEAATSTETIELVSQAQPDVVVLDLDLGGESGLELIPQLRSIAQETRIIVLTGVRDIDLHRAAVSQGAVGLVFKWENIEILLHAIEQVATGQAWLDPGLVANVLTQLSRPVGMPSDPEAMRIASLTERERAVIALVGEGLQNKAIGERLYISDTTVRHHLTSIFAKLEIVTRLELVIYAYRHGLARLPQPGKLGQD